MEKNNHFPIQNQVTDDCRKKIQEEKVIEFLKENRVILAQLGYEINKKKVSDISE
tara:strand:- start:25 stop:189 length:165 start_codon:yes stop_codon:yes gene_type:complete